MGFDDLEAHFGEARELTVCQHRSTSSGETLRVDGEVLTLPEVCMDCMAVRGTRALVATIQSEAGFRHRRNKDDKR